MRHLVSGQVVEHEGRRQDHPPREAQPAGGRARAPAAACVAQRDLDRPHAERGRVPQHCGVKVALRLALEEVEQPPVDVLLGAGDDEDRAAVARRLAPHRAAGLGPVLDAVIDTAERQDGTRLQRHRVGQARHAGRDPAAMPGGKVDRRGKIRPLRQCQHDAAGGGADPQGEPARRRHPPHRHPVRRAGVPDHDMGRIRGRLRGAAAEAETGNHASSVREPRPLVT